MALLEGLSEDVLKTVAENLPITRERIAWWRPWNITDTKPLFCQEDSAISLLTKGIGIDYVHANELEIIDGKLTGKY
jgi:phosphoserine phosphatase